MPFSRSLFGVLPAKGALAIFTAGALALLGCAADVGQDCEGAGREASADSEALGTAESPQIRGFGYGPQPWMAGYRVRYPGNPSVFMIDGLGYRRLIPNASTYNNLYRSWDGIYSNPDYRNIPLGAPLPYGAYLGRPYGSSSVYFMGDGYRRLVSPGLLNRYNFNLDGIRSIPYRDFNAIPYGLDWY